MPPRTPAVRLRTLTRLPGTLGALLVAGCTAAQFGSEISARPKPTPIRTPAGTTIRIPQDQPFSIALPRDHRAPGLAGRADARAAATSDGTARALARVEHSGRAEAQFQLGHAFANETARHLELECSVRFACEVDVRPDGGGTKPDATARLRLYARQPRGPMLRDLAVLDHASQDGPLRRTDAPRLEFTITLGPHQTVQVFLAGQVSADIPGERTASAELNVNGLELHVVSRPAPERPPGADPVAGQPGAGPPPVRSP